MSTSICQGLQSCLEPGLAEPRVLRLKLALLGPSLSKWNISKLEQQKQEEKEEEHQQQKEENDYNAYEFREDKNNSDDNDMKNGLSFLEVLTAKNDTRTENVYVHPMVKRSASMLSAKSLEMCTESLGSETGSDSADEEMSLLSEAVAEEVTEAEARKSSIAVREVRSFKRPNRHGSFPPPLTSVGGSASFKVRPHREDGRLVLQAVPVTSSISCFQAERADGRLTLRLLKNFPLNKEEEEEGVEDGVENEIEQDQDDYEEEEETEETEEVNWGENEGEEMDQAEKIQRLSRCKEDGHGNNNVLMNWDSFLVAT